MNILDENKGISKKAKKHVNMVLAISLWLFTVWGVFSFLESTKELEHKVNAKIEQKELFLNKQVKNVAKNIEDNLINSYGIPALYSKNKNILDLLNNPSDKELILNINEEFKNVEEKLGVDQIWLINKDGICIAASNYKEKKTFIGASFADRKYFEGAKSGKQFYQYAMGRITNIPGLFFSVPILKNNEFKGVVVAKINLSQLRYLVAQTESMLVDEYGVIILASDPTLEMQTIEGKTVYALPEKKRDLIYKKINFKDLQIKKEKFQEKELYYVNNSDLPYTILNTDVKYIKGKVIGYSKIDDLKTFKSERIKLFLLYAIVGWIFIGLIMGFLIYLIFKKEAEKETMKSMSLLKATMEATEDGIIVTDNECKIVANNKKICSILNEEESKFNLVSFFDIMKEKVADENKYKLIYNGIYSKQLMSSEDIVDFKNGEVMEQISCPQIINGKIVGRVWSLKNITEKNHAEKQIRNFAFYDALTSLPNRRMLMDRLDTIKEFNEIMSCALIFIDLDKFKEINDTKGHEVGDKLLIGVGERIKNVLRKTDMIARLGGDEFVVLLENINEDERMIEIAEKIKESLQKEHIINNEIIKSSASIGVKKFKNKDDKECVFKSADLAMYESKKAGRNTVTICDEKKGY